MGNDPVSSNFRYNQGVPDCPNSFFDQDKSNAGLFCDHQVRSASSFWFIALVIKARTLVTRVGTLCQLVLRLPGGPEVGLYHQTSVTHHVGLHTTAFHFRCFLTIWQELSVNRVYYFSFSGSLLYSGTSSACVTSSSGNILKSSLSGQFIITSKIPAQLEFPIWDHCGISVTHSM